MTFSSLKDKPCGANSRRLTSCSLKPLPASSELHLKAHPRIVVDDSLSDQGQVQSANWSGYAVPTTTAGSVTYVAGTWTVPAVTSTAGLGQPAYSAIWVGIDGFNDGTVEQLGTMQAAEVISQGRHGTTTETLYYAWVELYPQEAVVELSPTEYPVEPGDTITASVTWDGVEQFALYMASSRDWTYSATVTSTTTTAEMSAEWVVEAPSSGSGVLPLADFKTVNFMGCSADISGNTGPISSFGWDAMTMVSETQSHKKITITDKAVPSVLNSAGNGFSVAWEHD